MTLIKRTTSIIGILCLIALFATSVQAAENGVLYVTNASDVEPDSSSTVRIYLDNAFEPPGGAAQFKLYYSDSIIQANSVSVTTGGVVPKNLQSPITFAFATTSGIPIGDAWLANITFKALNTDGSTSELGLVLEELNDIAIPPKSLKSTCRVQNGTFSTKATPATIEHILYVTNVSDIVSGSSATVGVYLDNSFAPPVGAAQFKLYYNNSIIQADSVSVTTGGVVPKNLQSPITFAFATTSGIPTGDAWLANITFKALNTDGSTSELGLTLEELNDIAIPPKSLTSTCRVQNGTFSTRNVPVLPAASFTASVTTGTTPLTVQFTDTSTGDPTSWSWDFGDGNTSTDQHPVHTYVTHGRYTVRLTVTNANGDNTTQRLSCVTVLTPGKLVAWGDNYSEKCTIPSGTDFIDIDGGYDHSVALRTNGSITAWGSNSEGQCDVPAGKDFTAVAAGGFHNVALRSDGSLIAWGSNSEGQCDTPAGNDFITIAAGSYTNLALRSNGSLVAWGWNKYNQCNVPAGNDFAAIDAGAWHALALRNDGSLVAWGSNLYGQCNVPADNDFVAIAAGDFHNVALRSDDSLVAWGRTVGSRNTSVGNNFTAIAAGSEHNVALRKDSSLTAWGGNTLGQCDVPSGNDYVNIATGGYHSLAIVPHTGPVTDFTANVTSGVAPLTVQFTDTTTDDPTSWLWTFGDSATSTDQNPVHTYTVPGIYNVSLTVSNSAGSDTETKLNYITVTAPVQITLSFDPPSTEVRAAETTEYNVVLDTLPNGLAGFNVTVALTNSSVGELVGVTYPTWANMPVNGSLPADTVYIQAVDLMSSVGAGATNVILCTLTVRGDAAGTANLTITATKVDDDIGGRYAPATAEAMLTVEGLPAPAANFTANVTSGTIPLTARFTDTSTGDPTSWSWSFGDGNTSTKQHPVHTYTVPGNHTVTLTVDGGLSTATKPSYIKVTPVLFGDANEDGKVNQADTLTVLQEVVGLREQPDTDTEQFRKTDVRANNVIEVGDALFIAQYNVGLRDIWFEVI